MNFKTTPYAHQLEAFNRFKDAESFALFMDMGTGKSKVAIDIATHKYETKQIDAVLIIAPNHVHAQWVREQFPTHCNVEYEALVWHASKSKTKQFIDKTEDFISPKINKLKVFSVNVEAFQYPSIIPIIASYVKNNTVFTIVDEATRIKNPSAKRSATIHKLEKYGHKCILTGTPVTKSPFGLWSMFEFLKHNYFNCNYFMFQAKHGIMMQGMNASHQRYKTLIDEKTWGITLSHLKKIEQMKGRLGISNSDFDYVASMMGLSTNNVMFIWKQQTFMKYKNLDELKQKVDPITFYATKEECLDLPEKVYETVYLEMTPEHKKVYKTLKTELLVKYEEAELTVLNKAALTTRLMQVCGGYFPYNISIETIDGDIELQKKSKMIGTTNMKIERLKEELEEISVFPVIIWAKFIVELEHIYTALKNDYKCALYYGRTTTNEREQIIKDFKEGKYEVFIGNPSVAGFGLNLQNATTQIYYSNGFNVEERLQAEDRSHRMGVKSVCLYKDIVYKNTIDEKITAAITAGRDMNDYFRTKSLREILSEEEE